MVRRFQKRYNALPIEADEEQTRVIRHPEWLDIRDPENDQVWQGARQKWYSEKIRRQRGCGPTTAALITAYLARKGRLVSLYQPYKGQSRVNGVIPADYQYERDNFIWHMQDLWFAFSPRLFGTATVETFRTKISSFARGRGVDLETEAFHIRPWTQRRRRNFRKLVAFIQGGLDRDLPLAFLNYHGGQVTEVGHWHWMTVIGLKVSRDSSQAELLVSNHGRLVTLSLDKWFYTARSGGGFVSFINPDVIYELVKPEQVRSASTGR